MSSNVFAIVRYKLAYLRPYLASAVWALTPVETPGLGTFAVDKHWRCYWDPAVATMWTIDEMVAVLYHETLHLLRDHPDRGSTFDNPMQWNIAADAEINDDIRSEKDLGLPNGLVYPEVFNSQEGKLAEVYYHELEKQKDKNKAKKGLINKKGCGIGKGDGKDYELGAPGNGKDGGAPGLKQGQSDSLKRRVAKDIKEASNQRGAVPGHLKRYADEKLKNKVDWRKELAAAVRFAFQKVSGKVDYTYARPGRRTQIGFGHPIRPSMFAPAPNVAVILDTSGSIGNKEVAQAMGEIGAILDAIGGKGEMHVLCVDSEVATARKVFRAKDVEIGGGGGTDMREGYKWIQQNVRPYPNIVICLTDGYTPWPESRPRGEQIVVLAGPYAQRSKGPSWAKVIVAVDEEAQ